MGLFDRFTGPYTSVAKRLRNLPNELRRGTWQIVPGPHGLPTAQLDLTFDRSLGPVANPDMTLAVVLDNSGSMSETFSDGHAYDACYAVLQYVSQAGVGYDLTFYNSHPSFFGHVKTEKDLRHAINHNPPTGGTHVTEALMGVVDRYKTRKGLYIICITDGEFSDKDQVEKYVTQTLLPKITPDNPYAFRLHFIGAGHGVDREFLERIEGLAAGQGVPLVTSHHHEHIRHAHDSMMEEMDRAFIGAGRHATLTWTRGPDDHEDAISAVGDFMTRAWTPGASAEFAFVPRRVSWGLELAPHHPKSLPVHVSFSGADGHYDFDLNVPMPAPQSAAPGRSWFRWPWGESDEQRAAREAAERHAEEVHTAELKRQAADLAALGQGGIPVQARERLEDLRDRQDFFTSDLAPDELALLRLNGVRARGLVTGSAMYHVGQAFASTQGDVEVKVLSDAYNHATALAVGRMREELKVLGGHGVVGVRYAMMRHEWSEKAVEVQLVGTAIELPGRPPAEPWLSDLSGQEWWALHRAGYEPVALVWGHCTWFLLTSQADENIEKGLVNQELTHWSQGLSKARHIALEKVRQQARQVGGHGISGVRIERRLDEVRLAKEGEDEVYKREHHNLVLSILGTAIRLRPDAPALVPATRLALSLRGDRLRPTRLAATSEVRTSEEV